MKDPREYCTCGQTTCPNHPRNHEHGCDLCIQKNQARGEIPACFFNMVGDNSDLKTYYFKDFANHVLRNCPQE